jgi:sigma-E factor negative regulatory protein RseB
MLGAAAMAADDPRDWLARTEQALATRNYEGVFVHEHAGESETLRVIHRMSAGGVSERLLSMDGSGREFIRKGTELYCYLPDRLTVLVERSPDTGLLLGGVPRIDATAAGQYEVRLLARARVSGRDARVIAIVPLDDLRYGYRVWIDETTAMPLKTQLRDTRGGVLEQIVFTSLQLPAHIPDSDLETAIDARPYRWVRHDIDVVDSGHMSVSWQASSLPPGFHMLASARQMLPGGPVEHLVFSDGLASVSVFIENGAAGGTQSGSEDAAALGSSSAYSTVVQGYRVIAVGEVPPETVRVIANAIRSAGPAPGLADALTGGASPPAVPPAAQPPPRAAYRGVSGGVSGGMSGDAPPAAADTVNDSRTAFGGNGTLSGIAAPPPYGFAGRPGPH